jgi:hypothetical protein
MAGRFFEASADTCTRDIREKNFFERPRVLRFYLRRRDPFRSRHFPPRFRNACSFSR